MSLRYNTVQTLVQCPLQRVAFSSHTPVALVSSCRFQALSEIEMFTDTSCILVWLIEQGYEVYAFLADVGQEEVGGTQNHRRTTNHLS